MTQRQLAALGLFFASLAAAAEERFDYQFGFGLGNRTMDWELSGEPSGNLLVGQDNLGVPFLGASDVSFTLDESLPTGLLHGTLIHRNFYLNLGLELPLQNNRADLGVLVEPAGGPGLPLQLDSTETYGLDRIDFAATLGYQPLPGLTLFGGYKYSEFDLTSKSFSPLLGDMDSTFTEDGVFIGASYNFRFNNWGTLGLSLGYASLGAEFSQSNVPGTAPAFAFALQDYSFNGNARGLSYGAQWVGDISDHWTYRLGIKYQDYISDGNATVQNVLVGESFPPGGTAGPYSATGIRHSNVESEHEDILIQAGVDYRLGRPLCKGRCRAERRELNYQFGFSAGARAVSFNLDAKSAATFAELPSGIYVPLSGAGTVHFDFDDYLYTGAFQGTLTYGRTYLTASLELPLTPQDVELNTEILGNENDLLPIEPRESTENELDRIDLGLTLGYRLLNRLNFLAGYKYTEFDLKSKEFNSLLRDTDQNYVEEGLFLGLGYSIPMGDAGNLSFSLGYAYLDNEFSQNNVPVDVPEFGLQFGEFAYQGGSTGLSYGVHWTREINANWSLTANARYQRYESSDGTVFLETFYGEGLGGLKGLPVEVTDVEIEHEDLVFMVGVVYRR
jgi:hypothetical protein